MISLPAAPTGVFGDVVVGQSRFLLGILAPMPWVVFAAFVFVFGCCIGSFLNVCVYRIPLEQSVVRPRSHCMSCGSLIPWYHNLPVISYFVLRGKCAKCGAKFSFRYAAVEAFAGLLFVLAFCSFPAAGAHPPLGIRPVVLPADASGAWEALRPLGTIPVAWVMLSGLLLGSLIDLDHYIIPDSVTIGGMVAGLCFSVLVPQMQARVDFGVFPGGVLLPVIVHPATAAGGLLHSAIGLCAGFCLLQAVRLGGTAVMRKLGRIGPDDEAMGFGDVKLLAAIGAFLGWQAAVFSLVAGAFFGIFGAIPALVRRVRGPGGEPPRIPFGPFLAMGAAAWLFWGPRLVFSWLMLVPPWRLHAPWL